VIVVDVSLAEPGMVLLRDVRDNSGKVLVHKDERLTEEIVEKLKGSDARFLLVRPVPTKRTPDTSSLRSRTTR